MSEKKHRVELTREKRRTLNDLIENRRTLSRRQKTRALMLLKVDEGPEGPGLTDEDAAKELGASISLASKTRRRYSKGGLKRAIKRKSHTGTE